MPFHACIITSTGVVGKRQLVAEGRGLTRTRKRDKEKRPVMFMSTFFFLSHATPFLGFRRRCAFIQLRSSTFIQATPDAFILPPFFPATQVIKVGFPSRRRGLAGPLVITSSTNHHCLPIVSNAAAEISASNRKLWAARRGATIKRNYSNVSDEQNKRDSGEHPKKPPCLCIL